MHITDLQEIFNGMQLLDCQHIFDKILTTNWLKGRDRQPFCQSDPAVLNYPWMDRSLGPASIHENFKIKGIKYWDAKTKRAQKSLRSVEWAKDAKFALCHLFPFPFFGDLFSALFHFSIGFFYISRLWGSQLRVLGFFGFLHMLYIMTRWTSSSSKICVLLL